MWPSGFDHTSFSLHIHERVVRNNGSVPGGTGQRARKGTRCATDEITDSYFNDIQGESGGRRPVYHGSLRVSTPRAYSPDSGSG